jgi:hypothetical protein
MPTYVPSASVLVDILLPADGENIDAVDVNAPLQEVADGIAYNGASITALTASTNRRLDIILTSGTWTCPAGVTSVILSGYGGGGQGAGGQTNSTATDRWAAGGGGGGGSWLQSCMRTVVPTTVYTVTIGAGGTGGGLGGATPAAGTDGGDTSFDTLAIFAGASGGNPQVSAVANASTIVLRPQGGAPVRGTAYEGLGDEEEIRYDSATVTFSFAAPIVPATGGHGSLAAGRAGRRNPTGGYAGGALGAVGVDSGSQRGGGGGGGGGAGPANVGGAGGNGSNGDAGVTVAGGNGFAANANSGAGGGGGGGSGAGAGGSGAGGNGAAGGSGALYISYQGPQAVIT